MPKVYQEYTAEATMPGEISIFADGQAKGSAWPSPKKRGAWIWNRPNGSAERFNTLGDLKATVARIVHTDHSKPAPVIITKKIPHRNRCGTMTTQHTPGPWFSSEDLQLFAETGEHLADLTTSTEGLTGATLYDNARLIAAAPDLLEALQGAIETADGTIGMSEAWWYSPARFAIARATGAAIDKATKGL